MNQDGWNDEAHVAKVVVQRLENLSRAGVTHIRSAAQSNSTAGIAGEAETRGGLPRAELREESRTANASSPSPESSPPTAAFEQPSPFSDRVKDHPPMSQKDRIAALAVIQKEVAACTRCEELVENRSRTVFGVGDPAARLCFLGEAPGADEDRQGEPFVGRAGQLLTKIIEACTLTRDDVYILNVLKCRPPGNRNPAADEVANCRGYLDRQLKIIQPEYICCLGRVAAKTLLDTDLSMARLRGRFHQYQGIPVLCSYHPAYLLRNPAAKKETWADMQLLMSEMGIEV